MIKPMTGDMSKKIEESSSSPILECLWTFSCSLTNKSIITSMALNKQNPGILAVGYGGLNGPPPFKICCWSLDNQIWPMKVFHCRSSVTSLEFSSTDPDLLAVGMFDGPVAACNIRSEEEAFVPNNRTCLKKHIDPVWRVGWTTPASSSPAAQREHVECFISVAADGIIAKWLFSSKGLQYKDMMDLRWRPHETVKAVGNNEKKNPLSAGTRICCFDLHPADSNMYLVGTWLGSIHQGSLVADTYSTYERQFSSVNHVEWSPFCSDAFLSCSDRTIELWKQDRLTPLMSFTSTQSVVLAARWSPKWPTIFAAINQQQLEIWDLRSSTRDPILVARPAPGVTMTSLLFAGGTDCVLVGDSDGIVTVYHFKNVDLGEGPQMETLEDIIA